jgi:NAD(P)-dependent dehydrogenase (short-subunit alcohol dehydrogenase family)
MSVARKPEKPEVVAITGAAAGVGRATVREFARHGAHVGLIARGGNGMSRLEEAKREVEGLGGKAVIAPADVANYDEVEAAAERIERELGPIDVWVNDAMTTVFAPFTEITPEEFQRATEVTYLGFVWGTKAALKRMEPRNRGVIVQVGSALAYRGIPLQSAYCGAKHAIQGFTESVRTELMHERSHVRLTMVQMPALNTPQFSWCLTRMPRKPQPVPPIYDPEVAADAIYFAAHHHRRQLYVGLPTLIVIQANKIVPWFGDWYLARTGFAGQQYDGKVDPNRPHNLWEPVPGDYAARGDFTSRSHSRSPELWAVKHRNSLVAAGVGLGAAAVLGAVARSAR